MKKPVYILVILTIICFAAFNIYKYQIYDEFRDYLNERYTETTFRLGWIKYDFASNSFFAKAHSSDEIDFNISKGKGGIFEEYLIIKNRKPINEMVKAYLMEGPLFTYIKNINSTSYDIEVLNSKNPVDYSSLRYIINIRYTDNLIQDNSQFAKISSQIIEILKGKGVKKIDTITFSQSRSNEEYNLVLFDSDIDKKTDEISNMVKIVQEQNIQK